MKRAWVPIAALVVLSLARAASPPSVVNYQGVLRSASGAPLSGTYDMIFRFTEVPSGGTLLLTEYHTGPNGVVVQGGVFSAQLGTGTLAPGSQPNLEAVLANHSSVWIEVQVGAETLSPRIQIVSAAFAVNAARLGGLPAIDYLDRGAATQTKAGLLASATGLSGAAPGAGTGVEGTSVSGTGVKGTTTVSSGTTAGVYGKASSTDGSGVIGEAASATGAAWGVYGKSASASGIGVLGSALATGGSTEGVRGQTYSPTGKGVVGVALATTGTTIGVYGESQSPSGTGVYGKATAGGGSTTGVIGDSASPIGTGVAGVARATSGDAWGVYGETASATGYGVVAVGGLAVDGDIYASGSKNFLVEHPSSPTEALQFACLEGDEVGVYHRGVARLDGGEAWVPLPAHFPLVATGKLGVHVTPLEESAGMFVPGSEITSAGFFVRESGGGKSNASFAYLVLAERAGFENARAVRPISLGEKVLLSKKFPSEQRAALREALARFSATATEDAPVGGAFEALHRGDFTGACEALGGCAPVSSGALRSPSRLASAESDGAGGDRSSRSPSPTADLDPVTAATAPAPLPATGSGGPWRDLTRATLSELHAVSERVEAGDVVVIDRAREGALRPGTTPFDPAVVGIVAQVPAPVAAGGEAPIALMGSVPCKVDADYGAVTPGDLLVVSPTAGHAMRARDVVPPGAVVGKALESLATGKGTILVLVAPR